MLAFLLVFTSVGDQVKDQMLYHCFGKDVFHRGMNVAMLENFHHGN